MTKDGKYTSEKNKKRALRKRSSYRFEQSVFDTNNSNYISASPISVTTLKPPNNFSIVENPNITLNFFRKLERNIKHKDNLHINASEITSVTEDAILYLLSRFHVFKSQDPDLDVGGFFPNDPYCRKMFVESGFSEFVKSEDKYKNNKTDIFTIRSGDNIQSEIIPDIFKYVRKYIKFPESSSSRVYGAIVELMQNSSEHAYSDINILNKWWLIATPSIDKTKVHYTFLDNGVGIPKTIQLKHNEIIQKIARSTGLNKLASSDTELIIKALEGNFRSQTKKRNRGNGLPEIFEISNNQHCENLTVISNHGMLKVGKNQYIKEKKKLFNKFSGTLITWDFVNPY